MVIELVDTALDGAVGVILNIDQALGAHLRTLDKVGELVQLLARVVGTAGHTDAADIGRVVKDAELAALHDIHQLDKGHAEAQVGLVAAIEAHSVVPRHLLQLVGKVDTAHFLEQVAGHVLKDLQHILLLDIAHLAVNLRELGLSIGTQVLVAEALGNLEVAVKPCHHQQLLERLRALRQSVELPGVHARGHDKVACSLGADENRGLHLDKIL